MKPVAIVSAIALLAALLLPVVWMSYIVPPSQQPVAPAQDSELMFTVLTQNGVETWNMADYLPGVLAGEMPALFESEALKAQAVAARTYIRYRIEHPSGNHPEADICDDPACCKAFSTHTELQEKWGNHFAAYYDKMCAAVRETDGQYLQYNGAPIQAVFHSSSAGVTQASGEIWNDCPYLQSVVSPETAADVPDFVTEVEISADDFKTAVLTFCPNLVFPDDPAQWLGGTVINQSSRADHTSVCGTDIPATQMRTLFGLRSTAYTLEYTAQGTFLFTVTGYGHGVGMSQYGANVYAKQGETYTDILSHYYPGTELVSG